MTTSSLLCVCVCVCVCVCTDSVQTVTPCLKRSSISVRLLSVAHKNVPPGQNLELGRVPLLFSGFISRLQEAI